jgi:5-formyltetrahydrofolate cyclo-ligase
VAVRCVAVVGWAYARRPMHESAVRDEKRALRARMRAVRREVSDPVGRAERIWSIMRELPAVAGARTVMVYESVPGEPDTSAFAAWCRERATVVVPDASPDASHPADPASIDVVIVPGLAFTPDGRRLGQGGGWYDRLLPTLRADALVVGVCFREQLVDALPVEDHDVAVHVVVTDAGVASIG